MGIGSYSKVNIKYFNTLAYDAVTKITLFSTKHLKNLHPCCCKIHSLQSKVASEAPLELEALQFKLHLLHCRLATLAMM